MNGQTIRTRTIKNTLEKYLVDTIVKYFDTSILFKIKLFSLVVNMGRLVNNYFTADILIIMLARRGVKYLFPIIMILNKT